MHAYALGNVTLLGWAALAGCWVTSRAQLLGGYFSLRWRLGVGWTKTGVLREFCLLTPISLLIVTARTKGTFVLIPLSAIRRF